jgi:transposase
MPLQDGKRAATNLERWQQVHDLRAQNVGLLDCARRLNLSLNTIKRYDRASEPERLQRVPKYRPTLVDPHRDYLRKRRAEEPAVPVQQLLREIREHGYQGSSTFWSATSTRAASTATARTCHRAGRPASCSPNQTASPPASEKRSPAFNAPALK